jgi:hypothetical protein
MPLVLAGPILRQVTPNAVTVWFALRKPALVSLRVFDPGAPGDSLMDTAKVPSSDPGATTRIGENLHIVALTVRADTPLVPGQIYCYDATIVTTDASAETKTLAEAIIPLTPLAATMQGKPLAYEPYDFPSFALPPADLNHLRLVHGSCRKPHGGWLPKAQTPTPDQLATLDGLIATDAGDALKRPHQLLLTGDQIYADDCDDELLVSLTDAGDVLLGWSGTGEHLPASASLPSGGFASDLAAGTRWQVITDAGFTGDDRRSHLLSLGEFFAMYLFVWSDVLWTDTMPYADFAQRMKNTEDERWPVPEDVQANYDDRQRAVQTFRETLPLVRRALANIPTYMILDDHEVTDDFNMTREFVDQVYADDLALRVVQNALTAFAICQVWGNVPEQFDPGTPTAAGSQLLTQLELVANAPDNAAAFDEASSAIMQLVGVHRRDAMNDGSDGSIHAFHEGAATDKVKVHDIDVTTKALRYNFTVEGPAHQVLVTDTRTWRGFAGHNEMPTLLYKQLDDQIISAQPELGDRLQLVVCSTNAPPIAAIRMLVRARGAQFLSTEWRKIWRALVWNWGKTDKTPTSVVDYWDLYDSWDFPSRDFDELIAALGTRLNRDGPVVLLSGDVHFSFSSRMAYWATARLGATTPQPSKLTIGQLVSSSLKNEADKTRGTQLGGYASADPTKSMWLRAAPYIAAGLGGTIGAIVSAETGSGHGPEDWLKAGAVGAAAGALLELVVVDVLMGLELPPALPEAYVGWNIARGGPDKSIVKAGVATTYPFKVTAAAPTFERNLNGTQLEDALITPDYRYRLDYLRPVRGGETGSGSPVTPVAPVPIPATNAPSSDWMHAYERASSTRTDAVSQGTKLPDCIGHNAIGEVRFSGSADPSHPTGKLVHHRLHWQSPGPSGVPMWTEYDVSLDIDDPTYPDLTKTVAP